MLVNPRKQKALMALVVPENPSRWYKLPLVGGKLGRSNFSNPGFIQFSKNPFIARSSLSIVASSSYCCGPVPLAYLPGYLLTSTIKTFIFTMLRQTFKTTPYWNFIMQL